MKKILLTCLTACLFTIHHVAAQETEAIGRSQAVYFEILGPGVTFSANYDTRFQNTNNGLGGRIGVSYFALDGTSIFTLPVQLNYLLGKNNHYFEVGAGATFASISDSTNEEDQDILFVTDSGVMGTMTFGYRRQPINGGFSFRGGFTPIFGQGNFMPFWPYVSFGYTF